MLDVGTTVDWLTTFFVLAVFAGSIVAGARNDHRRLHEFGVLRAIGFTDSDVRGTLAAESSMIALVAIAVGVPVGLEAGSAS